MREWEVVHEVEHECASRPVMIVTSSFRRSEIIAERFGVVRYDYVSNPQRIRGYRGVVVLVEHFFGDDLNLAVDWAIALSVVASRGAQVLWLD